MLIGKLLYRIFLTAFWVGVEIAIYLTVQVAYLRPAGDIHASHCPAGGNCPPFAPAVLALTIIQVVVGATIALGLVSLVLTVVRHKRGKSPASTKKTAVDTDIEPANEAD